MSDPVFVFSGPSRTLIAQTEGESIVGTCTDLRWLDALEADRSGERVVGAVPFWPDAPVRLFRAPGARVVMRRAAVAPPVALGRRPLGETRSDAAFERAVAAACDTIAAGGMNKIVLSRALDVDLPERPNVPALLDRLARENPSGFTYALRLSGPEPGTLVGVSPELLLSRRGGVVVSVPLAGSSPRSADPEVDRARASALLVSEKDRHEHRLVVEDVVRRLRPWVRTLDWEPEPTVIATPTLWHLSTRIRGELSRSSSCSSLRLALALHPTPAVCGVPVDAARSAIRRFEAFDRGFFTGALGHMDAAGDGDWIVTIRCAELRGRKARVFAGAGIVAQSEPVAELRETHAKMQTILRALGLD